MTLVLHMTDLARWIGRGSAVSADSLATEGFVHASPDEAAMVAVANAFYRDSVQQQVALVVDTALVGVPVRWEAADPAPPPGVAADVLFPHLYGPVPVEAVVEVRYARRDPGGRFTSFQARGATAEALDLLPHPEGGWYRSTWRSGVTVRPQGYGGERPSATAIHYLLGPGESSRWHRVRSDELWVHNRGVPLTLTLGGSGARPGSPKSRETTVLGPDTAAGQRLQALVPGGVWQCARPAPGGESVVSCLVSPGFDFADFEAAPED